MNIAGASIGQEHKPFVIAEMSGNHNQSLQRALSIVEAAAQAGAHALKIQTFTADTMTIDTDSDGFVISNPNSPWKGESLHKLYSLSHTPWEWHKPIFDKARELGLIPFSSPFDTSAVDFLETLNAPCYKIASFENIDIPLIKKCASTGKPLIISTGMATLAELEDAVTAAREAGCRDLVLLKCTTTYPASPEYTNIRTIPHLRQLFNCEVGLSDHTMGIGVATASVALGATVIEKHFTLARADGGVDASFSLEPAEMAMLVDETLRAWQALGQVKYGPTATEQKSLAYRRSLYAVRDIAPGETLTADNIRAIRPGAGLKPKYIENILGRKARQQIQRGTPLSWNLID